MKIGSIILFFIFGQFVHATDKIESEHSVLSIIENKFLYKLSDVTSYFTKSLADYNDNNFGNSEWGMFLGYNELKPKLLEIDNERNRSLKKMSMAMMPLIFHVGAASTWMLITSIMAAKSLAIGLLLLVFKIAVSSAKVASFFTLLKAKKFDHHHQEPWGWSSPHGHDRSLSHNNEIPVIPHEEWSSYKPEWSPSDLHSSPGYKTIPQYKEKEISSHYEELEYEDTKPPKADKKYG